MRKLTVLFAAALLCNVAAQAQKGVELAVSFTPMSTWIINDDDFEQGQDLNLRGTFGYLLGLTAGYNITDGFGIQSGIFYNKTGQNYITDYDGIAKADQDVFARKLGYIRVPVLFKVNGNIDNAGGMYFRVGPHFDFLQGAKYVYDDKGLLDIDYEFNMENFDKNEIVAGTGIYYPAYKIYKKFVLGATLEMGGSAKINDNMKLVFMLHLEGSLTNTEDEDAYRVYPSSNNFERATAWNLSGGLTVGFHYVIPVN